MSDNLMSSPPESPVPSESSAPAESPVAAEPRFYKTKKKRQGIWTKLILSIGAISFLSTGMFPLIMGLFDQGSNPTAPQTQPKAAEDDVTAQLKQQETGFLTVLQREPNNPNALQGLVDVRLKLGNVAGAKQPLEQLIKLYPEEQVLKDLLAEINKQLERQGTTPQETSPTTAPTSPQAPSNP